MGSPGVYCPCILCCGGCTRVKVSEAVEVGLKPGGGCWKSGGCRWYCLYAGLLAAVWGNRCGSRVTMRG